MATRVKGDPPHQGGSGSQARTRFARRAVVDAARALFLERGYQATTIDAISDRSDVPAATVYRLFSSFPVQIGTFSVPHAASWAGLVVAGALGFLGWRARA